MANTSPIGEVFVKRSEQLVEEARCPGGAVGGDGEVVDGLGQLFGDRFGQQVRVAGFGVREVVAGVVAVEAGPDVEVLLEVVLERDVDEGDAEGGELHAGSEAALGDGEVGDREMLVQVW
jgi:hypothetical protein